MQRFELKWVQSRAAPEDDASRCTSDRRNERIEKGEEEKESCCQKFHRYSRRVFITLVMVTQWLATTVEGQNKNTSALRDESGAETYLQWSPRCKSMAVEVP